MSHTKVLKKPKTKRQTNKRVCHLIASRVCCGSGSSIVDHKTIKVGEDYGLNLRDNVQPQAMVIEGWLPEEEP
jgi:hypothetical protein